MKPMDTDILQHALIGYEQEKQRIERRIAEIRKAVGRETVTSMGNIDIPKIELVPHKSRSAMSPAARKRIAKAQKARWAAYRKQRKIA